MSLCLLLHQNVSVLQPHLEAVQQASSLTRMVLAAWRLGLAVALQVIQEIVTQRAHAVCAPAVCPQCGHRLWSKGWHPRQVLTVLGVLKWERQLRRCPNGCKIGQVAPLDEALGLAPIRRPVSR